MGRGEKWKVKPQNYARRKFDKGRIEKKDGRGEVEVGKIGSFIIYYTGVFHFANLSVVNRYR
ncbi:MAG: hypothetical protein C6I01_06980 [Epsilonproteobacteria bacterium]|nr:hypothetical protein [Campylobacterota bacterium]